jgi:hypothetical protein
MRVFGRFCAFIALFSGHLAHAQAVCAEVKIEIPQAASLERQAFIAKLGIDNAIELPIDQLNVSLEFKDDQGNAVLASSDPNNLTAKFFVRLTDTPGITGTLSGTGGVAARTKAEANWLIIPASGAAGTLPQGKVYYIGAAITFRQGGTVRNVAVLPDAITVEAQPKLKLDYFLPEQVFSDDPFTPVVEPPEPFTLGVRIKNIGLGQSRATRIESAQPRIVENTQGLNIGFNIGSSYVQNQPAQPTLLLDFGAIESNKSKMGRWLMTTTLTGRFSEFTAEFTHSDILGGALTSLLDSVATHTLVKDVLVDLPGRDSIRDFLALDLDTYRSYESENTDTVVINRTPSATLVARPDGTYLLTFTSSILPAYVRVADPSRGAQRLLRATRTSDNSALPEENLWNSKSRDKGSLVTEHFFSLYDARGAGSYVLEIDRGPIASLSGLAFRDLDNDGIKGPNESLLPAVPVSLSGTTIGSVAVNLTSRTNASGNFAFPMLQPGNYSVAVGAMPGLLNGIHSAGDAGGTVATASINDITLAAGVNALGYQFAKTNQFQFANSDIDVTASTLTPSVGIGQPVEVTLRVKNNGPDDALLNFRDPLIQIFSGGMPGSNVIVSQGQVVSPTGNLQWQLGTLTVQSEATLRITLTPQRAGTAQFVAVAVNRSDSNLSNNEAVVNISANALPGELIFEDGFENPFAVAKSVNEQAPVLHFERLSGGNESIFPASPQESDVSRPALERSDSGPPANAEQLLRDSFEPFSAGFEDAITPLWNPQ